MLDHAWIIPLFPAASFVIILLFGRRLPSKGSEVGIAAVGIAFALALVTNVSWFGHVNDAEHEVESSEEHAAVVAEGESAAAVAPAQEGEVEEEHAPAEGGEGVATEGEGEEHAEEEGHAEVAPVTK